MKRVVIPLLIAWSISGVVTVALSFVAGFLGGACHCMTPVSILFPFGTFISMRTSWETAGYLAHMFQFPLYAAIIALVPQRLLTAGAILIVHVIAAVAAVNMYEWWR